MVLNPVTKVISHVVVKTKGHAHEEYLVPLNLITDTSVKHIRLSCSLGELGQLAPFMKTVRVEEAGLNTMSAQALAGAESQSGVGFEDFGFGGTGKIETIEEEAIPETELAVRRTLPCMPLTALSVKWIGSSSERALARSCSSCCLKSTC